MSSPVTRRPESGSANPYASPGQTPSGNTGGPPGGKKLLVQLVCALIVGTGLGLGAVAVGAVFSKTAYDTYVESDIILPFASCVVGIVIGTLMLLTSIVLGKAMISNMLKKSERRLTACQLQVEEIRQQSYEQNAAPLILDLESPSAEAELQADMVAVLSPPPYSTLDRNGPPPIYTVTPGVTIHPSLSRPPSYHPQSTEDAPTGIVLSPPQFEPFDRSQAQPPPVYQFQEGEVERNRFVISTIGHNFDEDDDTLPSPPPSYERSLATPSVHSYSRHGALPGAVVAQSPISPLQASGSTVAPLHSFGRGSSIQATNMSGHFSHQLPWQRSYGHEESSTTLPIVDSDVPVSSARVISDIPPSGDSIVIHL